MTTEVPARELLFAPRGGNLQFMQCFDPEVLVEGGTGTGKTFTILWRMHFLASHIPDFRGLIVRKTLISLTNSALKTFQEDILDPEEPTFPKFFGGSKNRPAAFNYPGGGQIMVGGLDDPSKVLSTEYDWIYVNEATELDLKDWETLLTRLRHGAIPAMQLVGDCNPAYDSHWLNRRCQRGVTTRIKTRHQDNPKYFDVDNNPTPLGAQYMASLQTSTDDRYRRFFLGEWVGLENAVYTLDPKRHLAIPDPHTIWGKGAVGVDYGRVHLSAIVAVQEDSTGVLWVRECLTTDDGEAEPIREAVRSQKLRFHIRQGRTDPTIGYVASDLGFHVAEGSNQARNGRIAQVKDMLAAHPAALCFDKNGRGVAELWDEMQAYHYELRETATNREAVIARVADDRVAAMEYAIEEMKALPPQVAIGVMQPPQARKGKTRIGAA